MFKHNLTAAFRSMAKQKMQTFILISGMAIGLTVSFWMFYWLIQEFSFENVHENADRIYRVELEMNDSDGIHYGSATPTPLAPLLEREFPEVVESVRLHPFADITLHHGEQSFSENQIMAVDPSIFSVFSLKALHGNLEHSLDVDNSIAINRSFAEKYFGEDVNPVGERLDIDEERSLVITAVFEDLPGNTHLNFEALIPLELADQMGREIAQEQWHRFDEIHTYILLNENADWGELDKKIAPIHDQYVQESSDQLYLQPLKKIHFASNVLHDFANHTDKRTMYSLALISLLVFAMACINFVTLTSAMTLKRRGAIDLRKVYGAGRRHIIKQILTEAFLYTGIAAGIAIICIELTRPLFLQLTSQAVFNVDQFPTDAMILVISLATLMGIVVGIFPAIRFSGMRVGETFRSKSRITQSNKIFHPLILVQFILTITLITGSLVIQDQISFMQKKSPGFDRDQLVSIPMTMPLGSGIRSERFDAFSDELRRYPGVQNVTMTVASPENIETSAGDASWEGQQDGQSVQIHWNSVWFDYFETLGVDIIEGRGFSSDYPGDVNNGDGGNFILNQTAVERMGLEDPVGKMFSLYGKVGRIVGVVEDFHYRPLNVPIEPMAFDMLPWYNAVLLVRLSPDNVSESLHSIESTWAKFNPGIPFEYEFVSSAYRQLYEAEQNTKTLVGLFTILAIILASLGLLGIVAFIADRRTKEIGIRKVLGATVSGIVGLLTKDFVKWIVIANVIAWPMAWLATNQWLQNYAYHIELTVLPFILAGMSALVIALLTVSWQAIRAARANPVDSLRSE